MHSIIMTQPDTMAMDMPQGAPGIVKDGLPAIGGQPTALNASEAA